MPNFAVPAANSTVPPSPPRKQVFTIFQQQFGGTSRLKRVMAVRGFGGGTQWGGRVECPRPPACQPF